MNQGLEIHGNAAALLPEKKLELTEKIEKLKKKKKSKKKKKKKKKSCDSRQMIFFWEYER